MTRVLMFVISIRQHATWIGFSDEEPGGHRPRVSVQTVNDWSGPWKGRGPRRNESVMVTVDSDEYPVLVESGGEQVWP